MTPTLRRLTLWNLLAQAGIIVTGVAVRATGSGLGCPTWPQCSPGSYVATRTQPQSWHAFVEYGNRLLTFVLIAIAVTTLVQVLRSPASDRRTRTLAWIPVLGTVAQAVLGGLTVLLGLHPLTVMAHFLLSIFLVWAAHGLWVRVTDRPRVTTVTPIARSWTTVLFWLGLVVLVLGSITTGSGPHSGDADHPNRFGLDPAVMAGVHAMSTMLFVGLAVGLFVLAKTVLQQPVLQKAALGVLHICAVQIVVGLVQYGLGLPWWMLIIHAALAAWFWIAVLNIRATVRSD